jgi:hypothetical protein
LREAKLHVLALRRRREFPTVVLLPGETREGGASNLRAYCIADELKRLRWNAYVCPKHLRLAQRLRVMKATGPDVILMQMARHPLNRPKLYAPIPVVFDIDDADYVDERQRHNVIDALENSAAVIAGSRAVAHFCSQHNRHVEIVWTGTPISSNLPRPQSQRRKIVTWSALLPANCPAEADFLLDVLRLLKSRSADFQFMLYCDDGSDAFRALAERFRATGVDVITRPRISDYSEFLHSLEDVAIGLAPLVDIDSFSGGKSFGKVLAYMASGVPIVTHPVVDHPLFFRSGENGYMSETAEEWAAIIAGLLDDADQRQRIADAARVDLERRLSIAEAAKRVDAILQRMIAG